MIFAPALAPDRVRAESLELSLYGRDASGLVGHATVVCFPLSTEEVQACVRIAVAHGRPFVTRGSGTGLAGGAVPLDDPVVIVTTKMNRVLSVDVDSRVAWVEPGVLNLDLSRAVAHLGLHFAPDPSSQQSCSVGGNVATNSGGPHCLAYGVTSTHVLAIEVVLPDGQVTVLGGLEPEPARVRPPRRVHRWRGNARRRDARSRCASLRSRRSCARCCSTSRASTRAPTTVSAIIAGGLVPAAIEMMDARITRAVEAFVHAGFPLDAAAVLHRRGRRARPLRVEDAVERVRSIGLAHGARSVRVAADRRRAGAAVEGPQVRRSARSPASTPTTTSTTRSCPAVASSRCCGRCTRSPTGTT